MVVPPSSFFYSLLLPKHLGHKRKKEKNRSMHLFEKTVPFSLSVLNISSHQGMWGIDTGVCPVGQWGIPPQVLVIGDTYQLCLWCPWSYEEYQ
jgi:hypothetical protein